MNHMETPLTHQTRLTRMIVLAARLNRIDEMFKFMGDLDLCERGLCHHGSYARTNWEPYQTLHKKSVSHGFRI